MPFFWKSKKSHLNKNKILINATNLKGGGTLQCGVSILLELNKLEDFFRLNDVTVFVSRGIDLELRGLGSSLSLAKKYVVFDMSFVTFFLPKYWSLFFGFDLIFNVFGPNYVPSFGAIRFDGFADVTLIYKDINASLLSFSNRILFFLKRKVKWIFYRSSDYFVVELPHVRDRLVACFGVLKENVFVVYNSLSAIFLDESKWSPFSVLDIEGASKEIKRIGFVGRDYKHKNLNVLPKVSRILDLDYGLKVKFYLTLPESEWESRDADFREACFNVGKIMNVQCPSFYMKMDGVIFPSLIECFSVTPVEALYMKVPLFASDRSFVRDVCGDYAYYFDPLNPEDIAKCIAGYFKARLKGDDAIRLEKGRDHVFSSFSSKKRAESYVEIIDYLLNKSS